MSNWMRSYAGLFLLHPNGWDFGEAITSNVSWRIPFRGKAWACSELFRQTQLTVGTEERSLLFQPSFRFLHHTHHYRHYIINWFSVYHPPRI